MDEQAGTESFVCKCCLNYSLKEVSVLFCFLNGKKKLNYSDLILSFTLLPALNWLPLFSYGKMDPSSYLKLVLRVQLNHDREMKVISSEKKKKKAVS